MTIVIGEVAFGVEKIAPAERDLALGGLTADRRGRGSSPKRILPRLSLLLSDFNLKRLAKRPRSIFGLAFHVQ